MRPFRFERGATALDVTREVAREPGSVFLAGGTTVVDLARLNVIEPELLVDVLGLPLDFVTPVDGGLRIGATTRNSDVAAHPEVLARFPVLAQALLAGASGQLRNMATVGGNLLQRTRCTYFRDVSARCNKRTPGAGCDARTGLNRGHAILGASESCLAVFPSDLATALAALDVVVHTLRPDGSERAIPFLELYRLPGRTPERETVLAHGELITHLDLRDLPVAATSTYLKVRDRASYEFALTSVAVVLDLDGAAIRSARLALGGVATVPWRAWAAERVLSGEVPSAELFRAAADAALADARTLPDNEFRVELTRRTVIRALTDLTTRSAS
jgi:xanthine dehydrogenase YagS FAD-binding subunit